MMTKEQYIEKCIKDGLCDERKVAFCTKAARLPEENDRIVLLTLYGTHLRVYKIDWHMTVEGLYYDVDLEKAKDLKIRTTVLFDLLRFTYNGEVFSFTNSIWNKNQKTILKELFEKLKQSSADTK